MSASSGRSTQDPGRRGASQTAGKSGLPDLLTHNLEDPPEAGPGRGGPEGAPKKLYRTDAQALPGTAPHPLVFIPSGRLAARLFGMAAMRPPNLIHLDRPVQSVRLQKTLADEVRP
jgi:hypothetical protein